MHCDDAPCVKRGKGGAVYKTKDGIVIIDPIKARGQRELVEACPYSAMWWNEERQVAQKCTLCAHLLNEGWKEPRCVQSCPTGALRMVKAEDFQMGRIIEQEKLEVLHPEFKTGPRIYYKNLGRYLKAFIGGNVAFSKDGTVDCAEGAKVALFQDSKRIGERTTDNYGDFKFDGLEENSGRYTIEAVYKAGKAKVVEVALTTSVNVGTILLEAG
jgi:NAD-dependent dihydropyrimidine dehydrogenase PreA subunit